MLAFVLITCDAGKDKDVMEFLSKIDEVREAYEVYGSYDIIVKLEAEGEADLKRVVNEVIRRIEGVKSTLTMIAYPAS